jgi:hypothetical protein
MFTEYLIKWPNADVQCILKEMRRMIGTGAHFPLSSSNFSTQLRKKKFDNLRYFWNIRAV